MSRLEKALHAYTERLRGAGLLIGSADVVDCDAIIEEVVEEYGKPALNINGVSAAMQSQQFQRHPVSPPPYAPPPMLDMGRPYGGGSGVSRGW
jgi:hypothetical protein